jgi:hypothetical protein
MGDCGVVSARVLSKTEGLGCGCGLVQEGEIAEFVYLVNSFIAPSLDNFLVAVDRHTPSSDSRLGGRECFCSVYSVAPIHR